MKARPPRTSVYLLSISLGLLIFVQDARAITYSDSNIRPDGGNDVVYVPADDGQQIAYGPQTTESGEIISGDGDAFDSSTGGE